MNMEQQLTEFFVWHGLSISAQQTAAFQTYMELPLKWNERVNLAAITEPQQVVGKHFLDSPLLLKAVEIPGDAKVIDIGTDAGFPGIPLLLYRIGIRLTSLDSLQERLDFLQTMYDTLGPSAELIHVRTEEGGHQPKLHEQLDLVYTRAAAPLPILYEYCLSFVHCGGALAAMRGPGAAEGSVAAKKAISILGARTESTQSFTLPDGNKRSVIICHKTVTMSDKYPRHGSRITKSPFQQP